MKKNILTLLSLPFILTACGYKEIDNRAYDETIGKEILLAKEGKDISIIEILAMGKTEEASMWTPPEDYTLTAIEENNVYMELLSHQNRRSQKLIIQFHGGAYLMNYTDAYRDNALTYAQLNPINVLSVDYRTAPEHVFPAALEDALTAWDYALKIGYLPENIILVGDSSGGNLALALALTLRDTQRALPKALILMSPWTDMSFSTPSNTSNKEKDPFFRDADTNPNTEARSLFFAYAGDTDLQNPLLSPYFAEYHDLPPMLIQVGTHEILEDDSVGIYNKIKEANGEVTLTRYKKMFHVFQLQKQLKASKDAWKEIEQFINVQFDFRLALQAEKERIEREEMKKKQEEFLQRPFFFRRGSLFWD